MGPARARRCGADAHCDDSDEDARANRHLTSSQFVQQSGQAIAGSRVGMRPRERTVVRAPEQHPIRPRGELVRQHCLVDPVRGSADPLPRWHRALGARSEEPEGAVSGLAGDAAPAHRGRGRLRPYSGRARASTPPAVIDPTRTLARRGPERDRREGAHRTRCPASGVRRRHHRDGCSLLLPARCRARARLVDLGVAGHPCAGRLRDGTARLPARGATLRLACGAGCGRVARGLVVEHHLQPLRHGVDGCGRARRRHRALPGARHADRAVAALRHGRRPPRTESAGLLPCATTTRRPALGCRALRDPIPSRPVERALGHRRVQRRRRPGLPADGPVRDPAPGRVPGAALDGVDLLRGRERRRVERGVEEPP